MSGSVVVTVRLPLKVKQKLERLARSTKRSRNFLAAEAITEYIDVNEWQVAGIGKALKELDGGKAIPHRQVKAWAESLGSEREQRPPHARKK